ncbi:MAG: hypothetical protein PHW65_01595 [Dehalococcoidales bacterium]|nr:hypothetical protein [Dehalococcoidales bacterium]
MDWITIAGTIIAFVGVCVAIFFGILKGFDKLYEKMEAKIGKVVEANVSPVSQQFEGFKKKYEENVAEERKSRDQLTRQVSDNRKEIENLCRKDKALERSINRHERRFKKLGDDMQKLYDAFVQALKELGVKNGKSS